MGKRKWKELAKQTNGASLPIFMTSLEIVASQFFYSSPEAAVLHAYPTLVLAIFSTFSGKIPSREIMEPHVLLLTAPRSVQSNAKLCANL